MNPAAQNLHLSSVKASGRKRKRLLCDLPTIRLFCCCALTGCGDEMEGKDLTISLTRKRLAVAPRLNQE